MKLATVMGLFAIGAIAAPHELSKRQTTANDVKNGSCKKYTFIMARGSTEPGNMVSEHMHLECPIADVTDYEQGISVGPATCSALKKKYPGEVACQGVGGKYTAGLTTNALPGGTDQGAISESESMFTTAAQKCPETIMVGGGYSQGAAVMTRSVGKLPENVKSRVAGVVLYGDTQNKQTGGSIPNYPKDQVLVICAATDGVCGGALLVTAGHLTYQDDVPKAAAFLEQQISAHGSSASSSSSSSTDSSSSDSSDSSSGTSSGLGGLSSLGSSSGSSGLSGLGGLSSLGGSSSSSADDSSAESTGTSSTGSSSSKLGSLFGGMK